MDALRAAVPLSRLFLALADSERQAEVRVRSRSKVARVHVVRGAVVAIEGVDGELLGDSLLRQGRLDTEKHRDALSGSPPSGQVGAWLIEVGAASPDSVGAALAAQLEARFAALLRWADPLFELLPARAVVLSSPHVSVAIPHVVWLGLSAIAHDLPLAQLSALAGDTALKLTSAGRRIVATWEPAERNELEGWLARAPQGAARIPRAVLRALGAAVDSSFDGDACNLLLRKQREIRRRVGPRALLDLPSHAHSEHARPALRRLAQKLHPDRFQALEPGLRAVSERVMSALSQAERELLASPLRGR
ncbi:MAG: J domain-containing protein [Myxococcales bacterium]